MPYIQSKSETGCSLFPTITYEYSGVHAALHWAAWEILTEFIIPNYFLGPRFLRYSLIVL